MASFNFKFIENVVLYVNSPYLCRLVDHIAKQKCKIIRKVFHSLHFALNKLMLKLICQPKWKCEEKKKFARMLELSEVRIDDGTITILPTAQNEHMDGLNSFARLDIRRIICIPCPLFINEWPTSFKRAMFSSFRIEQDK